MTIQEIRVAHRPLANAPDDTVCACDSTWRPNAEYRSHLAEVLDKHIQEREAAVLLKARDRMAKHWPLALDEFEAGEVCDWLDLEADKLKESTNGR